jgi:hypothetical protein
LTSVRILDDFTDMEKRLKLYVDKGRVASAVEREKEPPTAARPDVTKIKPLKKVDEFPGCFLAVDCSTRTLKRANNWGIYLMRATYALVLQRKVDWGYQERLCTVVGDAYTRSNFLTDVRIELESQIALGLLQSKTGFLYYEYTNPRSNYLLLDGGGYFGGERKFRVSLYDECEKAEVMLLAISKNSPSLHDEKGRDLIAAASALSPYDLWAYHPVRNADKDKSLYGDISLVKLCKDSPRVFRCDVMQYLTGREISETLAPLTAVAEDPRALGYPVPLWLAHEFSAPSETMLLAYYDQVENRLAEAGLLETLRREESICSFSDELHGVKHAFNWEWWNGQF